MIHRFSSIAHRPGRKRLFLPGLALAMLFLLLLPTASRSESMEYLLKAGFLEKFSRFTEWPKTNGGEEQDSPFTIAVIGENPFRGSLEELYTTEKIKNRPVRLRYLTKPAEIGASDMLFIAASEKNNLEAILKVTRGKPILVVGDGKGFAKRGCHINFYITGKGTVHFEIHLAKVKESGLHMQLVLVEIAKIID